MIDEKEIEITAISGEVKRYIISRMPYANGGREVLTQYMTTAAPKIGDYSANEKLFLKMMAFIDAIASDGSRINLRTPELVSNHVPDFQTGIKLEKAMLEHNYGFFPLGETSNFLGALFQKLKPLITKMLTDLKEQSSAQEKPQSTN